MSEKSEFTFGRGSSVDAHNTIQTHRQTSDTLTLFCALYYTLQYIFLFSELLNPVTRDDVPLSFSYSFTRPRSCDGQNKRKKRRKTGTRGARSKCILPSRKSNAAVVDAYVHIAYIATAVEKEPGRHYMGKEHR